MLNIPTPAAMPQHVDPVLLSTRRVEWRQQTAHSLLCTCRAHGKRKHYGKPIIVTEKVAVVVYDLR